MCDLDLHNPYFRPVKDSSFTKSSTLPCVTIYSDGSYKPAIEYGGYGTLMQCNGHSMMIYGGSAADSNNRMELMAVLTALRRLNRPCSVTVISDSQYVVNGINGYIWNWYNSGWLTSQKKPVANVDLWKEMFNLCQIHNIRGRWIKGHAGHVENETCDRLATLGAFYSANLPVPPTKYEENNLNKCSSPGDEDVDELPDYRIPYFKKA